MVRLWCAWRTWGSGGSGQFVSRSCAFFRSISWTDCLRTRYSGWCRSKKRRAQCSLTCGGGPSSTCARRRTPFAPLEIIKRRAWSPDLSERSRYVQTANSSCSFNFLFHNTTSWFDLRPFHRAQNRCSGTLNLIASIGSFLLFLHAEIAWC